MSNLVKTLDSGAELSITMASFQEANTLLKSMMKELEGVAVTGDQVNLVKNLISKVLGSQSIEAAIWPCLARATYKINDKEYRVTKALFDDVEESRSDYLPIVKEVLWFNLNPFFKNLDSLLKADIPNLSGSLSSK